VAQERNPVNGSRETEEIKHEIERTRIEMSETLGEIQDRLRPDHLLQQARDGVTQAAAGKARTIMNSVGDTASTVAARTRDAGNYVADYAIEHPIRIAIAVGAVTWWMLRGRGNGYDTYYGASGTNWDDAEADYADYGDDRSMRERVGEYASNARSTVSDYASSARETVGEYASSARDSARHAGMRVRSAASSATTSTTDWMSDNPLAAGAIALAVGVAIGLSAPRTDFEDDAIGETRDRAWERASQMAKNLTDNVGQKVATAAENLVGDSIKTAATTSPEPMGRA
jgi:ElaB/YqjD/DUF883 family membrane-anchored ribosome-binding protein